VIRGKLGYPDLRGKSNRESTFLCDGCNIARAVQNADNKYFVGPREVIDRVFSVEDHAQIGSQMRTRSTGKRKCYGLTESSLDLGKELSRE
jgi:hypothetical protein